LYLAGKAGSLAALHTGGRFMSHDYDQDIRGNLRVATTMYILALVIIASLVVGTHFIIDTLIQQQGQAARLISMSGRQRMLSEWIVKSALQIATAQDVAAREAAQAEMRKQIDLMSESHDSLVLDLDRSDAQTRAGAALRRVYFADPYHLDRQVRNYIALSKQFLNLAPAQATRSSPVLKAMEQATHGPIIDALNEVVIQYQGNNEITIHRLRRILAWLMAMMLATLVAEATFIFRPMFKRMATTQQALFLAATTDSLTGCMNRGYFIAVAERELARIKRYHAPLALLLLDIDHFKAINDTFGHAVGDEAIRLLADVASHGIRKTDSLARIGGEEFAVMLPETGVETALAVAEKLRSLVAATPLRLRDGRTHTMSVSIGVTAPWPGEETIFPALNRADSALYRAKHLGRNRVVCLDDTLQTQAA